MTAGGSTLCALLRPRGSAIFLFGRSTNFSNTAIRFVKPAFQSAIFPPEQGVATAKTPGIIKQGGWAPGCILLTCKRAADTPCSVHVERTILHPQRRLRETVLMWGSLVERHLARRRKH